MPGGSLSESRVQAVVIRHFWTPLGECWTSLSNCSPTASTYLQSVRVQHSVQQWLIVLTVFKRSKSSWRRRNKSALFVSLSVWTINSLSFLLKTRLPHSSPLHNWGIVSLKPLPTCGPSSGLHRVRFTKRNSLSANQWARLPEVYNGCLMVTSNWAYGAGSRILTMLWCTRHISVGSAGPVLER